MADNDLEITLTLNDQASGAAKAALDDVGASANKAGVEGDKATQTFEQGFRSSFREMRIFHEGLLVLTGSFLGMNIAAKAWADVNSQSRDNLDQLGESGKQLSENIGSLLAPTIDALTQSMKANADGSKTWLEGLKSGYADMFKSISGGIQFQIAYWTELSHGVKDADAVTDALKTSSQAVDEMGKRFQDTMKQNIPSQDEFTIKTKQFSDAQKVVDNMYLNGKITAQAYYNVISQGANTAAATNQKEMQLMQQLSTEEAQMRDKSLQDDTANTNAHMTLLKTLQSYHHTVYSTMQDFENSVITSFSTNMTSALTGVITGTESASAAFKAFGTAMLTTIVNFVIQYGIQMLIAAALGTAIMAQTTVAASGIAAAWTPAAILASIATLGGADATGTAALGAALAAGAGIAGASKFAGFGGGSAAGAKGVSGSFDVGTSSVPMDMLAQVHQNEIIVPPTFSDAIRSGDLSLSGSSSQQSKNQGDTYITIQVDRPTVSKPSDIQALTEEISRRLYNEFNRIH